MHRHDKINLVPVTRKWVNMLSSYSTHQFVNYIASYSENNFYEVHIKNGYFVHTRKLIATCNLNLTEYFL